MDNMTSALKVGDLVQVLKGCRARSITKGYACRIGDIVELGPDYGHFVRVLLDYGHRKVSFYARHKNRLSDSVIRLNDGRPEHVIEITKVVK